MQLSSLRHARTAAVAAVVALGSVLVFEAPWSAAAQGNGTNQPSPVSVNCEPNQQAMVRQMMVNGEVQVSILCAGAGQQQPVNYVDQYGRPLQTMPGAMPVNYAPQPVYAPQPAVYYQQPAYVPQPVAERATASPTRVVTERPAVKKRSWQKTAMVIGGSTGAGAGVGGLIGGKKGALIGAALGGGGATIYEAIKR